MWNGPMKVSFRFVCYIKRSRERTFWEYICIYSFICSGMTVTVYIESEWYVQSLILQQIQIIVDRMTSIPAEPRGCTQPMTGSRLLNY